MGIDEIGVLLVLIVAIGAVVFVRMYFGFWSVAYMIYAAAWVATAVMWFNPWRVLG